MVEFQDRLDRKCVSPKGTKYNSPGQGQASIVSQAAALGSMRRQIFGRARNFAINRRATEAETKPQLGFVLGHAASCDDVNRSDDGSVCHPTQGSRPGLSYLAPSGQSCGTHWLIDPQKVSEDTKNFLETN